MRRPFGIPEDFAPLEERSTVFHAASVMPGLPNYLWEARTGRGQTGYKPYAGIGDAGLRFSCNK